MFITYRLLILVSSLLVGVSYTILRRGLLLMAQTDWQTEFSLRNSVYSDTG